MNVVLTFIIFLYILARVFNFWRNNMQINHEISPTPREFAEQVLVQAENTLKEAVLIAFPETPDVDPITAFPKPSEVRAESPDIPNLTDERKANLLNKASELGFGRSEDVTLSEQGFIGANVIIEGGQPHKMLAEALMVIEDHAAKPKAIIICATPHREIKNESEIASAQHLFGHVGHTEYSFAFDVARALPGFNEYSKPSVVNADYDIDDGFAVSESPSGRFLTLGEVKGSPVVLMQISRRDLGDGKYDRQPDTAAVIGIIDKVTRAKGDSDSPIVHVTSGTYRPSRKVGVAAAGIQTNRLVGLATYGNDRLNQIKGSNAPAPVNQLPGELHEMAVQTVKLKLLLEHQPE